MTLISSFEYVEPSPPNCRSASSPPVVKDGSSATQARDRNVPSNQSSRGIAHDSQRQAVRVLKCSLSALRLNGANLACKGVAAVVSGEKGICVGALRSALPIDVCHPRAVAVSLLLQFKCTRESQPQGQRCSSQPLDARQLKFEGRVSSPGAPSGFPSSHAWSPNRRPRSEEKRAPAGLRPLTDRWNQRRRFVFDRKGRTPGKARKCGAGKPLRFRPS